MLMMLTKNIHTRLLAHPQFQTSLAFLLCVPMSLPLFLRHCRIRTCFSSSRDDEASFVQQHEPQQPICSSTRGKERGGGERRENRGRGSDNELFMCWEGEWQWMLQAKTTNYLLTNYLANGSDSRQMAHSQDWVMVWVTNTHQTIS